ncbi:hypothetical protein [Kutzneria sp. 744]|uniref:hypothetical protein n=1 Tax=Kutzneria sp. (strain 744) TaxID=345341 RepID=UPI0003EEAEC5|nr:hypothetical protein [Kutzneria sp. 744]EWM10743.1 hypothetical protein KUTG_01047 [Kutzneria sp. 744]
MALTKNPARPPLVVDGNPPEQRRRAARTVASVSDDPRQCAELLDMLGLSADDGLAPEE